mgnify:CR=1 FL=1
MTISDRSYTSIFDRASQGMPPSDQQTDLPNLSQFVLTDRSYADCRITPHTLESLTPLREICRQLKAVYYKAHQIQIETAPRLGASPNDLREISPDRTPADRTAAVRRIISFLEEGVSGHTGSFPDFIAYGRSLDLFIEGEVQAVANRKPGRQAVAVGLSPQYLTHNLALIAAEQATISRNPEQRASCLEIIDLLAEETRVIMPEVSQSLQLIRAELKEKLPS